MIRYKRYLLVFFMFIIVNIAISAEMFIDKNNGTIIDQSTGLMWQKNGGRYTNWERANKYCDGLVLAGKTDWRLPNLIELQSLVDYSRFNPAINLAYFPNTNPSNYWTITKYVGNDHFVWYVNFYNGHVSTFDKISDYCVRCVRGVRDINKRK